MISKAVLIAGSLLLSTVSSMAAQGDREHFFGLDLANAVLSPKPLGPPAAFVPLPVQAKDDRGSEPAAARAQLKHPRIHAAHVQREKKRPALAYLRRVRPNRNPLDAQASDMRVQVWPCKSGGICNWKR
jgi:hypothetical protein